MSVSPSFATVLTEAINACPKDIATLASGAGISPKTLYAYKNGTRKPPSEDRVAALAAALVVNDEMKMRLYAAAGLDVSADLSVVAADLVKAMPTMQDRQLAVELLRTQARFTASQRRGPADAARAARKAKGEAVLDEINAMKTTKGRRSTD